MTAWLVAAVAGALVGLAGYAPAVRGRPALGWLAALRALAVALVAAVALGAPLPGRTANALVVGLDVSASRTRGTGAREARAGADAARRLAGGTRVALVGESLRVGAADVAPADRATRAAALAESAAAAGVPLTLVTDGEVDDPDALARAPAGSRVEVLRPARGPDAAVVEVAAPAAVAPGETASVAVTVGADAAGSGAGRVRVRLDGGAAAERLLPALGPFGRATLAVPLPVPIAAPAAGPALGAGSRDRVAVLSATVASAGDREPRNDTAARTLQVTAAPRAVVVSTTPDYDVGLAASVLRGALAVPVRAYYRVAPGAWRVAGTLAPVAESEVRAAVAGAGLLVLHGDTAALGAPRTLGRGGLSLVPVVDAGDSTADWYAAPGPNAGPLAGLAGLPWDSLPPLDLAAVGDASAGGAGLTDRWIGVIARPGRTGPARAVVAGGTDAAGRRVAVVAAGGFWRWAFRGGAGAGAAQAVWGAVFDYLADAPARATQVAMPADAAVRSGARVRWRGLPARDSLVRVRLAPRGPGPATTLVVRASGGVGEGESDSPAPGVYDVPGGTVLVVNASDELLPRRPTIASGPVGAARSAGAPAGAPIGPGWPLGAATLLLCAEWGARRRLGLR